MSDSTPGFGEAAKRRETDSTAVLDDYEDNTEALVEYIRGNVIRNENQGVLLTLGWLTGWFAQEERYVNEVVIGSSSGGKTHLVRKLKRLIPTKKQYNATNASEKGFIDDPSWNGTKVAILSEWQKLPNDMREFMKSVAGDDGGYEYLRSQGGSDSANASGPAGANKIVKESKPYSFTYAQYGMDLEIWNRLFKNYISESQTINRAVARMHAGHTNITMGGEFDREYIFDTTDLHHALSDHVRSLDTDSYAYMPEWVFYSAEPILNMGRGESKRSSAMVFNLIRASALFNHNRRETTTTTVDGDTVEAVVVSPQDVANVLSCQEVILGTTHELEPRKMEIVDAVRAKTSMGSDAYCLLEDIQEYFNTDKSDMSRLKKDDLRELLRELEDNFVIRIHERAEGNAHGYEFVSLSQIGTPRVAGFTDFEYNSDDPFLGVDHPDNPFKGCIDPVSGVSFKESVEQFRESVKNSEEEKARAQQRMDAGSAMGGDDDSGSGNDSDDGQTTLGDTTDESSPVEYELDTPVEKAVYSNLREYADGEEFPLDGLENLHLLDIVEVGETLVDTDVSGTLLDPDHGLWNDVFTRDVSTSSEAEEEIDDAYATLQHEDVVEYEKIDDENIVVHVRELE